METVDQLVERLNDPEFDAVKLLNETVAGNKSVQEQYASAVGLMANLDFQSQEIHTALSEALEQLQKSEKRLPHEIDLLKNDVNSFQSQQSEKLGQISQLAQSTRASPVFTELAELEEIKARIQSVQELLNEAKNNKQPETAERMEQFAVMFKNTPDEGKWSQSGQRYYEFINTFM